MIRFTVEPGETGRVDRVLARRFPGTTRALLARFFADRQVRVDGAVAKKGTQVRAGAVVELAAEPPTPDDLRAVPEPDAPLAVLYEDADLIAIDKPPATATHPLRPGERGTAANALVARYPECAGLGDDPRESGFAHRLDTDTTGALVAARHREAWDALRDSFRSGRVTKEYLALVGGELADTGSCDEPIGNLEARTSWTVERRIGRYSLVRCVARTGRMHQIRIHLAALGAPIVGDRRYGDAAGPALLTGHFLHAAALELPHPSSGERLRIDAPLPAERAELLERIG